MLSRPVIHCSLLIVLCVVAGCYVETPPARPEVISARLIELLDDPDPDMRRSAAESLGKIGYHSAAPRLISALDDSEAQVRAAAALSLGRLGHPESGGALVGCLSDSADSVRTAAALALGELEPPLAWEALILARLGEGGGPERMAASRALLGLDSISFSDALARALSDPDPAIRQGVAAALGETGDVRAVPFLLLLLRTDVFAGVRAEAAFRLGKIGDDRVAADLAKAAQADSEAVVRGWARWGMQQVTRSHEFGSEIRPDR